jgi:hypothetical protein
MNADLRSDQALAQRKARLLREGEYYRVGIVHAKAYVHQGMRPESLMRGAASLVLAPVEGLLGPLGLSLPSLLPFAASGAAFLRRRKLLKPALGIGLIASLAATYLLRRRRLAIA